MNADQIKGNWKQLVGKAKEKWRRLTDDDRKVIEGKRDQLVGKLQDRYGIARDEAKRQVASSRGSTKESDKPILPSNTGAAVSEAGRL
jgi:uncharacterized protein YjbJ (UPF0337 family)